MAKGDHHVTRDPRCQIHTVKASGWSMRRTAQMVWPNKRTEGVLDKDLRRHGKRYNKRSSAKAGRGCIPGRVDISEHPEIVEKKLRVGDWEGGTIVGARHQGAIVSYIDRHSKLTLLKK